MDTEVIGSSDPGYTAWREWCRQTEACMEFWQRYWYDVEFNALVKWVLHNDWWLWGVPWRALATHMQLEASMVRRRRA